MKQALSFLTLGVHDLDRMKEFYRDVFGWKPIKDNDGIVFFKLNGIILALFPAEELADDIGVKNNGKGFKRFSLAMNFGSEQEVNDAFGRLKEKGAKVLKEPEKVFWGGYRGYVADAEDNYWELAYNPFLKMDEAGNVITHK